MPISMPRRRTGSTPDETQRVLPHWASEVLVVKTHQSSWYWDEVKGRVKRYPNSGSELPTGDPAETAVLGYGFNTREGATARACDREYRRLLKEVNSSEC